MSEENDGPREPESSEVESQSSRRARPRSLRSWRSLSTLARSRTRSRPRSPDDTVLRQVFSAGFHDDHGTYVEHEDVRRANEAVQVTDDEPETPSPNSKDQVNDE